MKNAIGFVIGVMIAFGIHTPHTLAQAVDEERMKRDIEVAENVLATLIKQEFQEGTSFFGLDVKGSYQPGYGVTFRVPTDQSLPFVISIGGNEMREAAVIADDNGYRYRINTEPPLPVNPPGEGEISLTERAEAREAERTDSARTNFNGRIIKAAQSFILDYGDFLSQLKPDERIIVTNQGERHHFFFRPGKRTRISVEGTRGDVTALRQGKLSREQALKKLTIVNTEALEAKDPDLEMLSTIFSRLYRHDLSKTYFVEGNVYYERLKDFGTIFYMQMVSSVERGRDRFLMPTLGLENIDQATRDKKVAEVYPAFEKELKDNILEYGRTVKSLKGDERLIFNISLTRCKGCGIPSTLELGIETSVLQDYGAGKMNKSAAMNKFTVKRGADQ